MGEAKRKQSATQILIEKYPHCFFCGGRRKSTTREHMPPKALFDGSHRPDKLVMPACSECNKGTSTADLTASVISRWDYWASNKSNHDHSKLIAQVRVQAPELVKEWTSLPNDEDQIENAREHLRGYGVRVPRDAEVAMIGPKTVTQLNLFSHKVALALHFEHWKAPLPPTGRVLAYWRTKEDFAPSGIPSELLALLPDYGTLIQGKWDERQTFEYRSSLNPAERLFGCLAKFRNGLFVIGFTIIDPAVLPDDELDWFAPEDAIDLLSTEKFQQRL